MTKLLLLIPLIALASPAFAVPDEKCLALQQEISDTRALINQAQGAIGYKSKLIRYTIPWTKTTAVMLEWLKVDEEFLLWRRKWDAIAEKMTLRLSARDDWRETPF